jgi:hypothetical protein
MNLNIVVTLFVQEALGHGNRGETIYIRCLVQLSIVHELISRLRRFQVCTEKKIEASFQL